MARQEGAPQHQPLREEEGCWACNQGIRRPVPQGAPGCAAYNSGRIRSSSGREYHTYAELCQLADSLQLKHATAKTVISAQGVPDDISIIFLHSVPSAFKASLLSTSRLLVYTPRNEHFGIVPLEAMLAGTPVLAANEGGPTETVVNGQTGWLRDVAKVQDWTEVMRIALEDDLEQNLREMGKWGEERVVAEFSKDKMGERLDTAIQAMMQQEVRPSLVSTSFIVIIVAMHGILAAAILWSVTK
jgi:alpha-1,3/alpha-1,6-mannosyltransferase